MYYHHISKDDERMSVEQNPETQTEKFDGFDDERTVLTRAQQLLSQQVFETLQSSLERSQGDPAIHARILGGLAIVIASLEALHESATKVPVDEGTYEPSDVEIDTEVIELMYAEPAVVEDKASSEADVIPIDINSIDKGDMKLPRSVQGFTKSIFGEETAASLSRMHSEAIVATLLELNKSPREHARRSNQDRLTRLYQGQTPKQIGQLSNTTSGNIHMFMSNFKKAVLEKHESSGIELVLQKHLASEKMDMDGQSTIVDDKAQTYDSASDSDEKALAEDVDKQGDQSNKAVDSGLDSETTSEVAASSVDTLKHELYTGITELGYNTKGLRAVLANMPETYEEDALVDGRKLILRLLTVGGVVNDPSRIAGAGALPASLRQLSGYKLAQSERYKTMAGVLKWAQDKEGLERDIIQILQTCVDNLPADAPATTVSRPVISSKSTEMKPKPKVEDAPAVVEKTPSVDLCEVGLRRKGLDPIEWARQVDIMFGSAVESGLILKADMYLLHQRMLGYDTDIEPDESTSKAIATMKELAKKFPGRLVEDSSVDMDKALRLFLDDHLTVNRIHQRMNGTGRKRGNDISVERIKRMLAGGMSEVFTNAARGQTHD